MSKIFLGIAIVVAFLMSEPSWSQSAKLNKTLVLEHAELPLTPAALTFDGNGRLYVGYRDKGSNKQSSAIWIRVIDPAAGRDLRRIQLQTAPVTLPNRANQFKISADNSVLVYAQFHESTFVVTLDSTPLQELSETTSLPVGADREFPKIAGIDRSGSSVLIAAERTNRNKGTDARLLNLSARDLNRVLSNTILNNPIPESSFAISNAGAIRIIRSTGLFATTGLYSYDSGTGKAALQLSVPDADNRSIVSLGTLVFLPDESLVLSSTRLLPDQTESAYLYRLGKNGTSLDKTQNIGECKIAELAVTPDQLYGTALCERHNHGELHFGRIESRTAMIFDTKTLKILAEVPIAKDLYPELAIWHGGGKIVLATQAPPDKLAIYELAAP
jgi:hypothetical protein